jgi:hypothetical protein
MAHFYEVSVVFEEEIPTKNGSKIKKVRETYLVEGGSVSFAENKVTDFLKNSTAEFEVKVVKESKIVEVIELAIL